MIDRYGRIVDYLRLSLTDKCNLSCVYCSPQDKKYKYNYINDFMSTEDFKFIIKRFSENGIREIKFTGGEVLLHPDLPELVGYAKECGMKKICITTNGTMLRENILTLKEKGLTTVNINMDSLKRYKYKSVTRTGNINNVLDGIDACLSLGIDTNINCVVINDFNNNEIDDFIHLTKNNPINIRFIELLPNGEANKIYDRGHFDVEKIIENLPNLEKVYNNDKNDNTEYYKIPGYTGKIGLLKDTEKNIYNKCNKIKISFDGKMKLYFSSEDEVDIKWLLHKNYLFDYQIKDYIWGKSK